MGFAALIKNGNTRPKKGTWKGRRRRKMNDDDFNDVFPLPAGSEKKEQIV